MVKKKSKHLSKTSKFYNLSLALFVFAITCNIFPIRILWLSDWWVNVLLYSMLLCIYVVTIVYAIARRLNNRITVILLLIGILLMGWQTFVSSTEIDNCWVEDRRYTQLIGCSYGKVYGKAYRQIEQSPIGYGLFP